MHERSLRYRGTATTTGMVTMRPDPDYTRGKADWSAWMGVTPYRRFALQVDGLDGTVELQGNNGRPDVAGEWYTLDTITADGVVVVLEDPVDFIRVNCTVLTSGTPVCMLTMEA